MPYKKPPTKPEKSAYMKAQKAVQGNVTKTNKLRAAFRKKHEYYGPKASVPSKPKPPPIPANKKGKRIPKPKPIPEKPGLKPKPAIDTDLFMQVSQVMTDVGKDNLKKGGPDLRERLRKFSPNQLKTAIRKSVVEEEGRTVRFTGQQSVDTMIDLWFKYKAKEKFLPKKAIGGTGQTKHLFILEGWGLFDDDEGESDFIEDVSNLKFKQSYPSGLQRYEGRMTDSEALAFGREYEDTIGQSARLYRETKTRRKVVWDNV
mgnify:FL=1|tara:strand:+ start:50 stop:826 length:777 start_codon:yes stop_codon:yes gene_type:complete